MMVGVRLRRGTPADATAAAGLWLRARAAAAEAGSIPPPIHDDRSVHAWFASHVAPLPGFRLAELGDGTLAGLLVLDDGWIEQLYVDPGLTGRGIGGRLLTWAMRRSPDGLQLWSFASNAGALRFYRDHGFAEVRRTDGRDNKERAPDVLLRWSTGAPGADFI